MATVHSIFKLSSVTFESHHTTTTATYSPHSPPRRHQQPAHILGKMCNINPQFQYTSRYIPAAFLIIHPSFMP